MCRQDSRVRMSAEEEIAAEESLSIYCKPVELYNILQRRAIKNVAPPKIISIFAVLFCLHFRALKTFLFLSFCLCSHFFFKDVCATKQRQSIKGGTSFSKLMFIFYAYSDANIFLSVVHYLIFFFGFLSFFWVVIGSWFFKKLVIKAFQCRS